MRRLAALRATFNDIFSLQVLGFTAINFGVVVSRNRAECKRQCVVDYTRCQSGFAVELIGNFKSGLYRLTLSLDWQKMLVTQRGFRINPIFKICIHWTLPRKGFNIEQFCKCFLYFA